MFYRRWAIAAGLVATAALAGCGQTVEGAPSPVADDGTTSSSAPTTSEAPETTTTPAPTTKKPPVTPTDYAGPGAGQYYFTTPSTKFECAIFTGTRSVAGCHGDFPSSVPKVAGSGAPDNKVPPNAVEVSAGDPGKFLNVGDPEFHRFEGSTKALPYGSALSISDYSCKVDESSGVTCTSAAGHGFTVSDSAYRVW